MVEIIDFEVTNCRHCVWLKTGRGHGDSWDACLHPKFKAPYGHAIEDINIVPEWCPLGIGGEKCQ